jgi:3-hydroxybutyryl-CoA dehydratase
VAGETVLDGEALVKVPTRAEADPIASRTDRPQG